MKPLSKKTRLLLYIGILFTFILMAGLSLPKQVGAVQSAPNPTPTVTPAFLSGDEPVKSGETGGLMLGAAIILLIIVSGVLIQRVIQKNSAEISD